MSYQLCDAGGLSIKHLTNRHNIPPALEALE